MKIQPGVGYTFDSSDKGFTLDTSDPFPNRDGSAFYQQFECKVVAETEGATTKFYLKTRKGVVNYTWSKFPFFPEPLYPGENSYENFERQARINDWAVYQNGMRTAGTATDGPDFEWMGNNGKIELPTGESGVSVLVLMSKIDWWDRDGWHAARRLIDAEMPFVSVVSSNDTTAIQTLTTQQGCSTVAGGIIYLDTGGLTFDPPYPTRIGYTFKKIAQLDWNDTTNKWDVTQYEYGPMNLPVDMVQGTVSVVNGGTAPTPSTYDLALANQFDFVINDAWFEGTWAIPSYTLNAANWWTHLVNN